MGGVVGAGEGSQVGSQGHKAAKGRSQLRVARGGKRTPSGRKGRSHARAQTQANPSDHSAALALARRPAACGPPRTWKLRARQSPKHSRVARLQQVGTQASPSCASRCSAAPAAPCTAGGAGLGKRASAHVANPHTLTQPGRSTAQRGQRLPPRGQLAPGLAAALPARSPAGCPPGPPP